MNERHDEIDDAVAVEGRLYLLTANAACWKCGRSQDVVAIAAQGLSEGGEPIPDTQDPRSLVVLSAIVEMPSELLAFIQQRQPQYQRHNIRAPLRCPITPILASVERSLAIIALFQSQVVLSFRKTVLTRHALK
jgi:hypothetical protein